MNPIDDRKQFLSRRNFLSLASTSLGATALNALLSQDLYAQNPKVFVGYQVFPISHPRQNVSFTFSNLVDRLNMNYSITSRLWPTW